MKACIGDLLEFLVKLRTLRLVICPTLTLP